MYHQNYDPAGNVFVSTLIAAIPICVLLYFVALHPHRDSQGRAPPWHLGALCRVFTAWIAGLPRLVPGASEMPLPSAGVGLRVRHAVGVPGNHLDRAGGDVFFTR